LSFLIYYKYYSKFFYYNIPKKLIFNMIKNYVNRNLFVNRACTVKEYSYIENINNKYKDSMEDG
jgi:hypothetical protein